MDDGVAGIAGGEENLEVRPPRDGHVGDLPAVHAAGKDDVGEQQGDLRMGLEQGERLLTLGRWFADMPRDERPEVVLASPYLRARTTAELIAREGGVVPGTRPHCIDERLREREFGVFDGLTTKGIREHYPDEAAHRAKMGKFYHRAPGGESWADVILRLRSALNTINLHYADKRVLVVAHQVVVLCMRYILEELTEGQILAIDKQAEILNCGIAAFDFEPNELAVCVPKLALWNHGAPMEEQGTPRTAEPDMMTGSR